MITLNDVVDQMKREGYAIDKRPDALNVVGIRTNNPVNQDRFDDYIAYFAYDTAGKIRGKVAQGTTDPSTYFLQQPMTSKGTAILKSGQYKDAYALGFHRGKYEALVQVAPVTVIRDADRDGYTNLLDKTEEGMFGINIHRPTANKADGSLIGKDSAGCQVFQYVNDFTDMLTMARLSRSKYGNRFTYTLLDQRDRVRNVNTAVAAVVLGTATLVATATAIKIMK